MSLFFVPSAHFSVQRPWLGTALTARFRSVTRRARVNRTAAACITATTEQQPGTEHPPTPDNEPPSVLLAEPPVPTQYMDPEIGSTSGVIMDDPESEDLSTPEAPKISQTALRLAAEHNEWLESLLAAFSPVSENHPFANAAAKADVRQPHPTRRVEEYRFTGLKPVYNARYVAAQPQDELDVNTQIHFDDGACAVLVFVDGRYSKDLSAFLDDDMNALNEAGGHIGSLEGADTSIVEMFDEPELNGTLKRKGTSGMFPALNTALASDCAVVDIPKDYTMSKHVVVLLASSGGSTAKETVPSAPRVAIRAASGSKVHVIESYVAGNSTAKDSETHALIVASTAVSVGDDAEVKHCVLGNPPNETQLLAHLRTEVLKRGRYTGTHFLVGGVLSRIAADIYLNGAESHGELVGASIADKKRVADLHSRIIHNSLHTTSKQLQKNIANDRSRTVFSGCIVVPQGCDGTDAEQLCRSLLLSDKAQVDAMPTLEIATDDVKASHGATVCDLQPDELFYLKSRGLSEELARALLISGFVQEVLAYCPLEYLSSCINPIVQRIGSEYQATSSERQLEMASI